jgi:branched-subunit amino acid aminotransferase/4-amino-4-deoxychorismate lyase
MRQLPVDEPASIEIDGQPPTHEQLAALALDSYGHFTAMQVRNGSVRGLALHQARLSAAHQELFGADLDPSTIRSHIRHALDTWQAADASVRVYLRQRAGRPLVMVTVRPPGEMPQQPWRLAAVPYTRTQPHIKHLGDFGQTYYSHLVQARGFDEALLTGQDGTIAEGSITNVGFYDGTQVSWPDAPMLAGITMQVLDARLGQSGLTSARRPITTADLGAFSAAFVTNARGIAAVGAIDGHPLEPDPELMTRLTRAYESAPWDQL